MEYYRFHKVYATETRRERAAETVEFFSQDLTMPKTSPTDMTIKAASELTHALQNPTPS